MRKELTLFCTAAALLAMTSCSSKLGPLSADYFSVTPNPLESQAGTVSAVIDGKFPEKYMKKKAVVTVTPELRAVDGTAIQKGQSATFQGEKVMGNDQTISYRLGGRYTMRNNFVFEPDLLNSELYLTFKASVGGKAIKLPDVKVATGIIATSELYKNAALSGGLCEASDAFVRVTEAKQEANIMFLVNQYNLRKSELESNSIQDFVKLLQKINNDREGLNIQNVEIAAYASPEGGFEFNDRLAGKRQDVSEEYVRGELNKLNLNSDVNARYTAQDWEGFQQLVQASNIQDKDVILRVLSMYKDPEERERQIRNMSAGFQELADGILPELRRARLTINYEVIGRSDDQLIAQFLKDATQLNVEELLYLATVLEKADQKKAVYEKTMQLYRDDYRAYNNMAVLALANGDEMTAQKYLAMGLRANRDAAESNVNSGLIALAEGKVADAEDYIAKGSSAEGSQAALGLLNIAKGNYAAAQKNLAGCYTNGAALAQILNKDYAAAVETLDKVETPDALTSYLHAIVAARRGNKFAANSYLQEALQKDSTLKTYSENDLEFLLLK